MGVVIRNFATKDKLGLWVFPEQAENINGLMAVPLDKTSTVRELVLVLSNLDTSFRWIFQGKFDSLTLNQTLSDFLISAQADTVSSSQLYRDGYLYQDYTFDTGTKIRDIMPYIISNDQSRVLASDDIFEGALQFADYVNGYAGNDKMSGFGATPTGMDIFFGGDGIDTAVFPSTRLSYLVRTSNTIWDPVRNKGDLTGIIVTNSRDPTYGYADLYQVERIQFSDGAIALDLQGVSGQAFRIYRAAFDRTPDTTGLGFWIAQMDQGMDVVEVAARFIDSPEFRQLYGSNVSNATFITNVYNNVLDRNPDDAGLTWWVNEMKTNPNKSWQKVLADFSESAENKANVASLIANGIEYQPWQ